MMRRSISNVPSASGSRFVGSRTPARSASARTASGKPSRSWRMRNPKASPPAPQPKQWKMPRLGLTVKEGVFSAWKGQSPFQCWPARLRFTNWPTSSTMSRRARISSRSWGLKFAMLCLPQDSHGGARALLLGAARTVLGHERVGAQHFLDGAAQRAGAFAVDDADRWKPRQESIVEILFEQISRLFARSSDQVELDPHRASLGQLDAGRSRGSGRRGGHAGANDPERL